MNSYNIPNEWVGKKINVALVGCGGTGSEMLDELYRIHYLLTAIGGSGIHLAAYDPSNVSLANIGRQRFWPCDIGLNKAEVLINRINSFAGIDWLYSDHAFTKDEIDSYDIIITCVDIPSIRVEIGQWKNRSNSTLYSGSCMETRRRSLRIKHVFIIL